MKRPTAKKTAPLTLAKKTSMHNRKVKTSKAAAKQQRARMPDYLVEEHPELLENGHSAWTSWD